MPAQLMEFAPPGPQRRPGVPRQEGHPEVHSWKTASGGSLPEPSFLSRLKAAPGLRFNAFRGGNAEGRSVAENRLVSVTITATGHVTQFGYDGMGRRVEIQEMDPDTTQTLQVTSDKKYLWDGLEIAEERDTTGAIVLRRFYNQGFVDSDGTALFYTRDHLGSIRELTDGTQAVRARYDYDPYGRMTKIQGDKDSPFTYTGYFWHAPSGLDLTLYRAYDPNLGRWISRDPIQEWGGMNLYAFDGNDPIRSGSLIGLVCVMLGLAGLDLAHIVAPDRMDRTATAVSLDGGNHRVLDGVNHLTEPGCLHNFSR
jgi:RHS repeat-associated protein